MSSPPLHTLGIHANQIARCTSNERMQTILQWVGVGSVILMGAGAAVHLFKDLLRPAHEACCEPYPRHKYREMKDDIDQNIRDADSRRHGGRGH